MAMGDQGSKQVANASFLTRLARDTRGNTLAIVGASLIPLIGMLGSGIDISRTYMANTRLQQACDAAALAGRRAMTDGTADATVKAEATKFFEFNFPSGTKDVAGSGAFGSMGFDPVITGTSDATVVVTASSVMPTTIMKIFGFANLPISVTCNARLDYVNTDIVLVLDTTGSMADKATSTDTDTKIVALRKAVVSFYSVLQPIKTQLEAAGLRMRLAVVPYASSINVGRVLRGVSTDYVANDTWTYQSRRARYQHSKSGETTASCNARGGTRSNQQNNNDNYTCTWVDTTGSGNNASFYGWDYLPMTYDISSYATGSSTLTSTTAGSNVDVPSRVPGNSTKATWAGCIEERATSQMPSTATSIPAAAKDLDIDLMPTSDKTTKWKPYWPEVEYEQYYDYLDKSNVSSSQQYLLTTDTLMHPQVACPTEAKRLQVWTQDALSTYLNTLNPDGGTYHDNGMIWGIRMLSGTGVFSADNPETYKGIKVAKYMIFMTDGLFDTGYETLYTTYGIERWDARATPGGSASDETDQLARHQNRFNLLCKVAKNRGINIWVVAFAQALDTNLQNCATNANQASTSSNSAQLNAKFVQIGQNIGALRLSQ